MAILISAQNGNFTDSNTWRQAAAGTSAVAEPPTSLTNTTNTTTSYVYPTTSFTLTSGQSVDGVVMMVRKASSAAGTVSVALSADNGATATAECTVNAADLTLENSLVYFKFVTPLAAAGTATYRVGIKGSVAGNATFVRANSTAANWIRVPVSTTAAATPAAADNVYVCGELSGSGLAARSVTIDTISKTTVYKGLDIGLGGTVSFGVAAATNYQMALTNDINIWAGGIFNIGTYNTPVPSTSTAELEFQSVTSGGNGIYARGGSSLNVCGVPRTSGKNEVFCLLTQTLEANAPILPVDRDTGWLSGDVIAVAGWQAESEQGALSADASTSSLAVSGFTGTGGALKWPKLGDTTEGLQTEVVLLTRNVNITGAASTNDYAFINIAGSSQVDLNWARFFRFGGTTSGKEGINVGTDNTGSFNMQYCSMESWASGSEIFVDYDSLNRTRSISIKYNVGYQLSGFLLANCGPGVAIENNVSISHIGNACVLNGAAGTFIGNRMCNGPYNAKLLHLDTNSYNEYFVPSRWHSNVVHGANTAALTIEHRHAELGATTIYDCLSAVSAPQSAYAELIKLNDFAILSCGVGGSAVSVQTGTLVMNRCLIAGISGKSVPASAVLSSLYGTNFEFNDCVFGSNVGIKTPITRWAYVANHSAKMTANNCSFAIVGSDNVLNVLGGTHLNTFATAWVQMGYSGTVTSMRHNRENGKHVTWRQQGISMLDSSIYRTNSPSEKLWPTTISTTSFPIVPSNQKMKSGYKIVAFNPSQEQLVSVWVRKSSTADGADYQGAAPRLMLKRNDAMGVAQDTVLSTSSSANGIWHQLSALVSAPRTGTLEFYVDCDGNTVSSSFSNNGYWVNVDDWSVTLS